MQDEPLLAAQQAMQAARALVESGRLKEAEAVYRSIIHANPDRSDAHNNLGYVLERTGRPEAAERSYRTAWELQPENAGANSALGNILRQLGRYDEAEQRLRHALAIDGRSVEALNNLGIVLQHTGRLPESVRAFQTAIEINPAAAEVHANLGTVLTHAGRLADAELHCRRALQISPAYPGAHYNLGVVLGLAGRTREAEQSYRRALTAAPQMASAHQNLGNLLLAKGAFAEGFSEYEWRIQGTHGTDYLPDPRDTARFLPRPSTVLPVTWGGKHILLLSDQGIGDDLFFLRFAPALRSQGARLLYRAPPQLAALVSRSGWVDEVVPDTLPLPEFDHCFAISDLALLAGVPAKLPRAPSHVAQPARVEAMRKRLEKAGPRPWIGVTWRAGTGYKVSEYATLLFKAIGPRNLGAILAPVEARVLSLQRNPTTAETARFEEGLGRAVVDLSPLNEDLEDMCALLSLLDAYVGVSNTNMHLQASLGLTARVLVPWPAEWRWMESGGRSPWFPGFQLFRQSVDCDWRPALDALAASVQLEFESGPLRRETR
jgi:Flp pilus assembly protein TadD